MLSFLIPTYNFNCLSLVSDLYAQCEQLMVSDTSFTYEIIIVDDGSPEVSVVEELMIGIRNLKSQYVKLIPLIKNVGLAAARNVLLREAKGEWVVFIDSDAAVITNDFVSNYWQHRNAADAIVGGIKHPNVIPSGYELRIAYERSYEKKRSLEWRKQHPYAIFSAFNLMMRKEVIERYGFDEHCREYGYEDFLLGVALESDGVKVEHIDNPLLHTGIDTSEVFLKKAETGVRTLLNLPVELREKVGLAIYAERLRKLRIAPVIKCVLKTFHPILRKQLLSARPSILLFQLYKLGAYLNGVKKGC